MLIIRGVNVFPTQIEERVLAVSELSPHYQIHVSREGQLDTISVHVETAADAADADPAAIAAELKTGIKDYIGVSAEIVVREPGGIPRSEGKAVRVIDERKI
jgi:phenylacetate-CoA ligase